MDNSSSIGILDFASESNESTDMDRYSDFDTNMGTDLSKNLWYSLLRKYTQKQITNLTIFLCLAASSITAISDPWLVERRRRDNAITISVYQEVIGKRISRSEALRIARMVLEQAEKERLDYMEFEAARGIQWRDEV